MFCNIRRNYKLIKQCVIIFFNKYNADVVAQRMIKAADNMLVNASAV